MKLLKIICLLFGIIGALKTPNVGQSQEMYLELTRKLSYLRLMKNLALNQRKTIQQKISNQQIVKFRIELAKAMQADAAVQASKRNADRKQIKSQARINRFRTFHN